MGEQLHVTMVLEGSVRKAGDKLRITAQLINVFTDISCRSSTALSVPNKRFSSCAPKHPDTQALLSAVPVVDPDSKRQRTL